MLVDELLDFGTSADEDDRVGVLSAMAVSSMMSSEFATIGLFFLGFVDATTSCVFAFPFFFLLPVLLDNDASASWPSSSSLMYTRHML